MATVPPTPPPIRFHAVPYQPDGGAPLDGLLLTLLFSCSAALVVGSVVSFIHQWVYLVLLFPVGMGVIVGMAGMAGVRLGRVRNSLAAGIVGGVAGALVMVASYYGDYLLTLQQLNQQGFRGDLSFTHFIDLRAEQGVTIGKLGAGGGKGNNLGYVGSYIYWLVEILVAAGLACEVLRKATVEPFCPACRVWKKNQVLGCLTVDRETILDIMEQGDLMKLADPDLPLGNTVVVAAHLCPRCEDQATVVINLKEIWANAKGESSQKTLGTWSFSGETLPIWKSLFAVPEQYPEAPG